MSRIQSAGWSMKYSKQVLGNSKARAIVQIIFEQRALHPSEQRSLFVPALLSIIDPWLDRSRLR